ncbi:hypothetical protein ABZP36_012166 [Zizania latifolia]
MPSSTNLPPSTSRSRSPWMLADVFLAQEAQRLRRPQPPPCHALASRSASTKHTSPITPDEFR